MDIKNALQNYISSTKQPHESRSLEDIDQITYKSSHVMHLEKYFSKTKMKPSSEQEMLVKNPQWGADLADLPSQVESFQVYRNESEDTEYDESVAELKLSEVSISDKIRGMNFLSFESFAELFVDEIIDISVDVCEKLCEAALCADDANIMEKPCICNLAESAHFQEMSLMERNRLSVVEKKEFSGWPTIKHFTVTMGKKKIMEFMDQWYFVEDWKYTVFYITSYSDMVSDFHLYQGMWSIPTKEYPIAQATASIYFTIEVSRVKPKFCKVNVTLQFEGSSNTYRAGQFEFIEQWLFNIIDSKINLFKTLRF